MASSTKWRIYITDTDGHGWTSIGEVQMFAAGSLTDLCTGGTATASAEVGGYEASKGFDDNASTRWMSMSARPQWLQYEFASAQSVVACSLTVGAIAGATPKDFALEYWNGSAWVALFSVAGETTWDSNGPRFFSSVEKQAWRIYATNSENATWLAIAEMELHATVGGADQCTGGVASALAAWDASSVASKGFDDNAGTAYTASSVTSGRWLQYTLTAALDVVEYSLTASTSPTYAPKTWKLQHNNGTGGWTDFDTQTNAAAWSSNEERTFTLTVPDTTDPTPGAVTVTGTDFDEITVNVGAGSDDTAVTTRTLQVFSDSGRTTQVGTDVEASVGDNVVTGLSINTTYWVRVVYADAAGNTANGDASGSTLADTTAPTPGTVTVTGLNDTQLNVAVGAGSDNVAVTSRTLKVYSDAGRTVQVGTDIAATTGDNVVSGLTAETTYYVTVIYADAAGNTASVDAEGATLGDCWIRVAQAALEVDYTIPSAALIAQSVVEVDLTGTTSVQLAHAVVEIDYVLGTDDDDDGDGGGTPNDGTTVPPHVDEEIILGYDPQKHRIGLAVSYAVDEVVKHDLYAFDNEAGGWGRIEPATDAYDFDTVTCRATAERDADAHLLFGNAAGQSLRVFDPDNAPVAWEWRSKEATGADFGGFAKTFQFTGLRVDWHKADPTLSGSVTATVFVDGKPMPALNIAESTSRTYVLGPRATGHRCSLALEGVNAEVTALRYSLAEARN